MDNVENQRFVINKISFGSVSIPFYISEGIRGQHEISADSC